MKAQARWNFVITYLKLFEPESVEFDDGDWWIVGKTVSFDIKLIRQIW